MSLMCDNIAQINLRATAGVTQRSMCTTILYAQQKLGRSKLLSCDLTRDLLP